MLWDHRAIGERANPALETKATETIMRIVNAIREQVPKAFEGLDDVQQAYIRASATAACVSSANITRDYQSPLHTDDNDVCDHPLMSALAWFPCGMPIAACSGGIQS